MSKLYFHYFITLLTFLSGSCFTFSRSNNLHLDDKITEDIKITIRDAHFPVLVLRIKETDCTECLALELNNINKIEADKIIILANFANERALAILSNQYSITCPILNIKKKLNNKYDNVDKPYYFILQEDKSMEDIYVSDLSDPAKSVKHLKKFL